jgi:hypothetical protein
MGVTLMQSMRVTVVQHGMAFLRPAEFRELSKQAAGDGAYHWHRKILPQHFTNAASTRYGYTPRIGERGRSGGTKFARTYTGRKLRLYGHSRPLVWTGESMLRALVPAVRRTARGAKAVIHSPGFNRRPKGGLINMRSELERFTVPENEEVAKVCEAGLTNRIKSLQTTEIIVI